jgi:hypothetical protein
MQKGHLARLYQRPLIDPKKTNKEVFLKIYDIPNEFLKYGGDIMIKSLSDLFTCISDFVMIPDDWCKGIIKPLHKSGSIYTGCLTNFEII